MVFVKATLALGIFAFASNGFGKTASCGVANLEDGPNITLSLSDENGALQKIRLAQSETSEVEILDQVNARISNTEPIGYYAGRNSTNGNAAAIDIRNAWTNSKFAFSGTMTLFSTSGVEIYKIGCNLND